jgi:hypothetical protein
MSNWQSEVQLKLTLGTDISKRWRIHVIRVAHVTSRRHLEDELNFTNTSSEEHITIGEIRQSHSLSLVGLKEIGVI